jgi:single-stranded-DNA-specific exonuclease
MPNPLGCGVRKYMRTSDEIIEQILVKRGVTDPGEFFAERPTLTYDPFLLSDMEEGAETVHRYVSGGKRICVYGDYDADGILSVALLTDFLSSLPGAAKEKISWYIPSRFGEGYGLNMDAIERIRAAGADLMITVDCGVAYAREVAAAMASGMDVVVTDHHEPDPASLPAAPSIDPKTPGSAYPFTGLCGCAVAFKLAQAIRKRYYPDDGNVRAALNASLDLVAVATVADVMPLTDENRTLVKYGLKALNTGTRWQLKDLAEAIRLKPGEITAYHIAFVIAPHLNAAGRMGDASLALDLLKAKDRASAEKIITELIGSNAERRAEQDGSFESCAALIDENYQEEPFLLVKPPRIHEGVAGIVAGKIRERYCRPAAVLSETEENGESVLKGSARSIPGIDVTSLLRNHEELLVKYGGHAMAAGFVLRPENEEALREALRAEVNALAALNPDIFSPSMEADSDLLPEEATVELALLLEKFEPTGEGNLRPVFRISGLTPEGVRRMGSEGRHMKFSAGGIECVLFARGPAPANLPSGGPFDLYGSLEVNRWNDRERVQFIVSRVVCPE